MVECTLSTVQTLDRVGRAHRFGSSSGVWSNEIWTYIINGTIGQSHWAVQGVEGIDTNVHHTKKLHAEVYTTPIMHGLMHIRANPLGSRRAEWPSCNLTNL